MSHYTIDYSKLEGQSKIDTAIADIKSFLGIKKFKEVTGLVKECKPPMTGEHFEMMVSFAGIQGYPAQAWAEHCGLVYTGNPVIQ